MVALYKKHLKNSCSGSKYEIIYQQIYLNLIIAKFLKGFRPSTQENLKKTRNDKLTIYLSHVVFVIWYCGFFAIIAENSHNKQARSKFLTLRLLKIGKNNQTLKNLM